MMTFISKIKKIFASKNALSAVFFFSLLGFLGPAINVFLLPLYLACLTPEDYGILSLVAVVTSVIAVFTNLKLDIAVRTFYFDFNQDDQLLWKYLAQIFSTVLVLSGLSFLLFLWIGPWLFDQLFVSEKILFYPYGFLSLAAALLTSCTTIYFVYLKNKVKLKEYSIYTIGNLLLTIALQFYMVYWLEMGINGVLIGTLIPAALTFVIVTILNRQLFTLKLSKSMILPSLKFAIPLIPFVFLFVFEKQLDKLIIERYLSLEMVGLYAILISLVGLTRILLGALDNAIRPFLYQSLKEGGAVAGQRMNAYLGLYLMIGLVGLSGVVMIGSNLDLVTDNERYLSVRNYFTYACIATIPLIFVRYFALIFVYYKKSQALTIVTFIKTVVMVALMVFLIPLYGINGAITALFVSYLINFALFYLFIKNYGAPKLYFTSALIRVFLFLGILLSCWYLLEENHIKGYGIIQFCLIGSLLIFLERKNLVTLAQEG